MGDIGPVPLAGVHDAAGFDCGYEILNSWLRNQALRNEGKGSRTYVVCEGSRIVGYYALAAGHVDREKAPSKIARNMPDPVPVFLLGRLAIDVRSQGSGFGQALLKDALKRSLRASLEIGARAVIVHALDDRAATFYIRYGFQPFPTDVRTLFIPMGEIAAAL